MNRLFKFRIAVCLSAFLIIISGCNKEDLKSTDQKYTLKSATNTSYTGEDMFKGIFFFEGDLAYKIDFLKNFKQSWESNISSIDYTEKVKFQNFTDKTVSEIKKVDPYFFEYFEYNMKSGNPLMVKEALYRGGDLLTYVFYDDPTYSQLITATIDSSEKIDLGTITKPDGSIDIDKLNIEIERIKSSFSNSNNTLSNFGMNGNVGTTLCAQSVAAITTYITIAWGQSYFAVFNVGLAVNAGAIVNAYGAVNVNWYLNKNNWGWKLSSQGGGSGGGGGGGGGTGPCSAPIYPEYYSKKFGDEIPNVYPQYAKQCKSGQVTNTVDDMFVMNVANVLKQQ